eukprot:TRINITY_DN11889_c0_g2_i1.p1 TRINITY_DN11889_c0_g2~~TRINITY_DN11889_c0_g2_i1.p1  ORF type:complete len:832 (+),score=141.97 TRINITY_DN11889_c0_g2_i1:52-2547(+)
MVFRACWGRRLAAYLAHDGDSAEEVVAKCVWVLYLGGTLTCPFVAALIQWLNLHGPTEEQSSGFVLLVSGVTGAIAIALIEFLISRKLTESRILFTTALLLVSTCMVDLAYMGQLFRTWPYFVVIIDILLLVRAPEWLVTGTAWFTVLWLFVAAMEIGFRMGLADLPFTTAMEWRYNRMCTCANPPCKNVSGLGAFVFAVMVVLATYYTTRKFRNGMDREREAVLAAISAAKHVAACLAVFDLIAASEYLKAYGRTLPPELLESYTALLQNLSSYRPFLPREFFLGLTDSSSVHDAHIPPGHLAKDNAIVFTNVCEAATLWANAPESMKNSIQQYSHLARRLIEETDGYQVNAVGDSFVVAFHTAHDAVAFGVELLAQASGPAVYHETPLRLRIGIDYGPCVVQKSVLTGRYEYFGSTVNRASAAEQRGIGNAVTVTREVLNAMNNELPLTVMGIAHGTEQYGRGSISLTVLLPHCLRHFEGSVRQIAGSMGRAAHSDDGEDGDSEAPTRTSNDREDEDPSSHHDVPLPLMARSRSESEAVAESASVCVLRLPINKSGPGVNSWYVSDWVETVSTHLNETGGCLSTVFGGFVVVSWGVQEPCAQHVNESARFLILTHRSLGEGVVAGLATGPVRRLAVSASPSQSFMTLSGPTVDLAHSLCLASLEINTLVLTGCLSTEATDQHHKNPTLKPHLRPIDQWDVVLHMKLSKVVVLELNVRRLSESDFAAQSDVDSHPAAWSGKYWGAFLAGDVAALRALSTDLSVRCAADLLERNEHLPHALMRWVGEADRVDSLLKEDLSGHELRGLAAELQDEIYDAKPRSYGDNHLPSS